MSASPKPQQPASPSSLSLHTDGHRIRGGLFFNALTAEDAEDAEEKHERGKRETGTSSGVVAHGPAPATVTVADRRPIIVFYTGIFSVFPPCPPRPLR